MKTPLSLLACAFLLVPCSLARADDAALETARTHLQKGRYAEAVEAYEALGKGHTVAAAVGRSRAHAAVGEWDEAESVVRSALEENGKSARLQARLAWVLFQQGDYAGAEKAAEAALKIDPDQPHARLVLADVLTETGRIDAADDAYRWFVRYYNRKQPEDAESLLLVAAGAAQYARWHSVSQIFSFIVNTLCPDALQDDELSWQASFVSGALLLEKYNRAQAIPEFEAALAINPRASEVLVALGSAALQKHDRAKAEEYAEQALKVDDSHAGALRLLADVRISEGEIGEALERLEAARAVNRRDQRTLARIGACYLLVDGIPENGRLEELFASLGEGDAVPASTRFGKLLLELREWNPKPGAFLEELGGALEGRRKYAAAERCYLRAMELVPQLSGPKTSLGMLYMRTGRTAEAKRILDEAFEADPYHVRVSNTRKVIKVLDEYETLETEHFQIHFDGEKDRLLAETLAEYLEEVRAKLVEEYGFEPPGKVQFEIYNEAKGLSAHQWFSARMIGLPWIQTIGATTGHIVAFASPNAVDDSFNWARVARHEFVHVITLQQTDFNIPHWFTEALAVSAEGFPRPQIWNRLLMERVPERDLRNLDDLNEGFIRPKDSLDWQFAYCLSKLYVDYARDEYGAETVPKLLDAYKANKSTAEAIEFACGVDKATFEKGFLAYLDDLVSKLRASRAEPDVSPAEVEKAYRANPDDPDAGAAFAALMYDQRQFEKAREAAEAALAKNATHPRASVVLAKLQLRAGDSDAAAETLEAALDEQVPDPGVLKLLAALKLKAGEPAEAGRLYALGRKTWPHDSSWAKGEASAWEQTNERAKLKSALRVVSQSSGDEADAARKLAVLALADGEHATAAEFARRALHVDVRDVAMQKVLGRALAAQDDHADAEQAFGRAVRISPDDADALLGLAKAQLAQKEKDAARETLQKLLAVDGDHAEARRLLDGLE